LVIAELVRGRIEYGKGDPGVQLVFCPRERFELVVGRHHRFIAIDLVYFALLIRPALRKEARPVEVQIGIEMRLIEGIDERGPALGNGGMAKDFSHHRPILTFHQGIIIGLVGTGFGEFDQELALESGHPLLIYSEPLSEWNPRMGNGNADSNSSRALSGRGRAGAWLNHLFSILQHQSTASIFGLSHARTSSF